MKEDCNYNELIKIYLKAKTKEERSKIKDKFIICLYKDLNKWIARILNYYCIPYDDKVNHFNEVFFFVYEKVFIKNFDKILRKYDHTKSFKVYLYYIIHHATIDWIRQKKIKINKELPVDSTALFPTNLKILKKKGMENYSEGEIITLSKLEELFSKLEPQYSIIIKLKFIAYFDLTDKEIEYLSKNLKLSASKIKEKVQELKDKQRNSKSFIKSERAIELLSSLFYRFERQKRKIDYFRKVLEKNLEIKVIENLEEKAENITLKEAIKNLKNLKNKKTSDIEILKAEYILEFKRFLEIEKRIENKEKEFLKISITPSKEIASFLNISPENVDTRFYRAKALLKKFL